MVADETALVLVQPGDTVDDVITKVYEAGSSHVQLLVPDDTAALQALGGVERLHRALESANITLLLISSDEKTLEAARICQLEAVGVHGARIHSPGKAASGHGDVSPYATRPLPVETAENEIPADLSESDADFLQALDGLSGDASGAAVRSEDEDLFAALDELSETMNRASTRGEISADDDFAAELDSLSDMMPGDVGKRPTPATGATTPSAAPRQRIRPEDIELTDEEKSRAESTGRVRPGSGARPKTPARQQTAAEDETIGTRRPGWMVIAIAVILLLLLVIIGAVLIFGNQATVSLTLPEPVLEERPFSNQVIPRIAVNDEASQSAVQAQVLRIEAVYTTTGQVASSTMAPASSASGVVTILSQNQQPFAVPQGTVFLALNAQGQEVRFVNNEAVTVPPASQNDQGAQIILNLGQAQVAVNAQSSGSASNVDANSIVQMIIPDQPPIDVTGGFIRIQHGPITGGSEQEVWIVKDTDVQQTLGEALTGLNNQARSMLETEASNATLALEATTGYPPARQLSQGQGYEVTVTPPVGELVDAERRAFQVIVRGEFSALATPPGQQLSEQLQLALPEQLRVAGLITPSDGLAPIINNWQWDGERLSVDGILEPTGAENQIDARTQAAIKDAIKGKSRAEAEAALENFVQQGVISSYTLPDREALPGWDSQINLQIAAATTP